MKKGGLFIPALALALFACNQPVDSAKDTAAVIQADKDFNDYCAKNGQASAFIKYADSSLIELQQGALPIKGITALKASYAKPHDTISKLTWAPEKGEASGNIGYTSCTWKFYTKTKAKTDTIYYGVYVTVWKKQKDGTWKYVLDGGNDTPAY